MEQTATPVCESVESKGGKPCIRRATPDDIPALERLIEEAVRGLHRADYGEARLESALRNKLLDVDPNLIADGTYFVAETDGHIVGSGGWSLRRNIINGAEDADDALDPATEAAKARAFYVHPGLARMGIGSRLLRESEEAAKKEGFRRMELISTLPAIPFYASHGWRAGESIEIPLPDGQTYPAVRMTKTLEESHDRSPVA